jgi:hypothetical protein
MYANGGEPELRFAVGVKMCCQRVGRNRHQRHRLGGCTDSQEQGAWSEEQEDNEPVHETCLLRYVP